MNWSYLGNFSPINNQENSPKTFDFNDKWALFAISGDPPLHMEHTNICFKKYNQAWLYAFFLDHYLLDRDEEDLVLDVIINKEK